MSKCKMACGGRKAPHKRNPTKRMMKNVIQLRLQHRLRLRHPSRTKEGSNKAPEASFQQRLLDQATAEVALLASVLWLTCGAVPKDSFLKHFKDELGAQLRGSATRQKHEPKPPQSHYEALTRQSRASRGRLGD